MKRVLLFVAAGAFAAGPWVSCAGVFDPAFRVTQTLGDTTIATPDAPSFTSLENEKAYPYGSRLKTDRDGSCVLVLSVGNECKVYAGATLTLQENPNDAKAKGVALENGKVDVALEKGFEANNAFMVETHCMTATALEGGQFSVDAMTESDLHGVLVACQDGKVKVSGPQFEIPFLDKDDWVSVSCSVDKGFTRIKNLKGTYEIRLWYTDGDPRVVELTPDMMVKIWRKRAASADAWLVTILIVSPTGQPVETLSGRITGALSPTGVRAADWLNILTIASPTTVSAPVLPGYGYPGGVVPPTPTPVGRGRDER